MKGDTVMKLRRNSYEGSKQIAKNRLKSCINSDRARVDPDVMQMIEAEIRNVVTSYIDTKGASFELVVEIGDNKQVE